MVFSKEIPILVTPNIAPRITDELNCTLRSVENQYIDLLDLTTCQTGKSNKGELNLLIEKNKQMRVLHVINNLNSGGAEKLLVDTLPLYKSEGIEVEVLQISRANSVIEYENKLRKEGISVQHLSSGSLYSVLNVLRLVRFLKKNSYDIIHVHLFPAMYWAALASKFASLQRPFIFTEHSTQNKRIGKFYAKFIDRYMYRSFKKVVAISEAISNKLVAWTDMSDRIMVIRNGVNTHHFQQVSPYPASFWVQAGVETDVIKIMMTARFSYPKDHETVLYALTRLSPNYHLILTGDGPQISEVKQMVLAKGLQHRVLFLGFRKDVVALMKSVDINILSSRYEGMSGVTLEALAAERPFLGSNVPGINDVVPDNRFLFEAANAADLALKIEAIIQNSSLQNAMISDGIKYIKTLDVMNSVKQYKHLYYNLAEKSRSK